MNLMINGEVVAATPEQEADIIAFQTTATQNFDFYKSSLHALIDIKANERDYGSAVACASYASSNNAQWAAEARAFIAWRDACYSYAYAYQAQVAANSITPDVDSFLTGLPQLVWPI